MRRIALRKPLSIMVGLVLLGVSATAGRNPFTFETIHRPGANNSFVLGINARGDMVGQSGGGRGGTPLQGFLLADGEFTTILTPAGGAAAPRGINARGDIVGRYMTGAVMHGFLLSDGIFTTIDVPDSSQNFGALGINAQGEIVGSYTDLQNVEHGYLLSGGVFTPIDFPGATFTRATGINASGDIVGFYRLNGTRGFVLRNGEFESLDFATSAQGINDAGDIVGFSGDPALPQGFVLRKGDELPTHLEIENATGIQPQGINARGHIVGTYGSANGMRGFRMHR